MDNKTQEVWNNLINATQKHDLALCAKLIPQLQNQIRYSESVFQPGSAYIDNISNLLCLASDFNLKTQRALLGLLGQNINYVLSEEDGRRDKLFVALNLFLEKINHPKAFSGELLDITKSIIREKKVEPQYKIPICKAFLHSQQFEIPNHSRPITHDQSKAIIQKIDKRIKMYDRELMGFFGYVMRGAKAITELLGLDPAGPGSDLVAKQDKKNALSEIKNFIQDESNYKSIDEWEYDMDEINAEKWVEGITMILTQYPLATKAAHTGNHKGTRMHQFIQDLLNETSDKTSPSTGNLK